MKKQKVEKIMSLLNPEPVVFKITRKIFGSDTKHTRTVTYLPDGTIKKSTP